MTIKQPLCRADLVDAVMASIHNPAAIGETYEALGPERMTQADLLTYMYALTSRTEEDLNFRYGVNIQTLFSSLSLPSFNLLFQGFVKAPLKSSFTISLNILFPESAS